MPQKTWDVRSYESQHDYVWKHGLGLLELLAPQPGQRILDLGCGAGHLSQKIAESGAEVIGLDSSPEMIAQARINYPKLRFMLEDARRFSLPEPVDAVFSNAALHWILPPDQAAARIADALKPGGRFVAELGGKGNIQSVLEAIRLVVPNFDNPWYFPSIPEYGALLEQHGLEVTFAVLFDRPTKVEGEDGAEEWLRMFASGILGSDQQALSRVVELLRPRLYRDGAWWMDYRRLRVVSRKVS